VGVVEDEQGRGPGKGLYGDARGDPLVEERHVAVDVVGDVVDAVAAQPFAELEDDRLEGVVHAPAEPVPPDERLRIRRREVGDDGGLSDARGAVDVDDALFLEHLLDG
jgi:hypothetical protein